MNFDLAWYGPSLLLAGKALFCARQILLHAEEHRMRRLLGQVVLFCTGFLAWIAAYAVHVAQPGRPLDSLFITQAACWLVLGIVLIYTINRIKGKSPEAVFFLMLSAFTTSLCLYDVWIRTQHELLEGALALIAMFTVGSMLALCFMRWPSLPTRWPRPAKMRP